MNPKNAMRRRCSGKGVKKKLDHKTFYPDSITFSRMLSTVSDIMMLNKQIVVCRLSTVIMYFVLLS